MKPTRIKMTLSTLNPTIWETSVFTLDSNNNASASIHITAFAKAFRDAINYSFKLTHSEIHSLGALVLRTLNEDDEKLNVLSAGYQRQTFGENYEFLNEENSVQFDGGRIIFQSIQEHEGIIGYVFSVAYVENNEVKVIPAVFDFETLKDFLYFVSFLDLKVSSLEESAEYNNISEDTVTEDPDDELSDLIRKGIIKL